MADFDDDGDAEIVVINQNGPVRLFENLSNKTQSVSSVNLDEEMANMIVLENAYAASARVISVTSELFDILSEMIR